MWLVLCDAADAAAVWMARGLERLGLERVEIVLPEELVVGVRYHHRVTSTGTSTVLHLHDGRVLDAGDVRGVLNRLRALPDPPEQLGAEDRAYAAEELAALTASWLASLRCPVLNRPRPGALFGPWRSGVDWRQLAAVAGLASVPWSSRRPLDGASADWAALVVGETVVGGRRARLDAGLVQGLARLGQLGEVGLFEAHVVEADAGPALSDVELLPPLPAYGEDAVVAVGAAFGAV